MEICSFRVQLSVRAVSLIKLISLFTLRARSLKILLHTTANLLMNIMRRLGIFLVPWIVKSSRILGRQVSPFCATRSAKVLKKII